MTYWVLSFSMIRLIICLRWSKTIHSTTLNISHTRLQRRLSKELSRSSKFITRECSWLLKIIMYVAASNAIMCRFLSCSISPSLLNAASIAATCSNLWTIPFSWTLLNNANKFSRNSLLMSWDMYALQEVYQLPSRLQSPPSPSSRLSGQVWTRRLVLYHVFCCFIGRIRLFRILTILLCFWVTTRTLSSWRSVFDSSILSFLSSTIRIRFSPYPSVQCYRVGCPMPSLSSIWRLLAFLLW